MFREITQSYDHIEPLLISKDTAKIIEGIIHQLPPQRQATYTMIKLENRSYKDVAQQLNISLGTVKDHMAKAQLFMKEKLRKDFPVLLIALYIFTILH